MFILKETSTNVVIDIVEAYSIMNECDCIRVLKNGIEYDYISCSSITTIEEVNPESIPWDFVGGKYLHINNIFILNVNYLI